MPSPAATGSRTANRSPPTGYGRYNPATPSIAGSGRLAVRGTVALPGGDAMRRATLGVGLLGLAVALGSGPPLDAACCYFSARDKDVLQPAQKAFLTWDPVEG